MFTVGFQILEGGAQLDSKVLNGGCRNVWGTGFTQWDLCGLLYFNLAAAFEGAGFRGMLYRLFGLMISAYGFAGFMDAVVQVWGILGISFRLLAELQRVLSFWYGVQVSGACVNC